MNTVETFYYLIILKSVYKVEFLKCTIFNKEYNLKK